LKEQAEDDAIGGNNNDRIPSDKELREAFKEETGRDPTPKELEEFKE
jgi:hypothetical protein